MILACVTSQESCERQIKAGAAFAKQLGTTLKVVSVQPVDAGHDGRGLASPELEHLYDITKQYHAEMNVFFNGDPVKAISSLIDQSDEAVDGIICGQPGMKDSNDFINQLRQSRPDVDIYMMSTSGIMLPLALESLSFA